MLNIFLQRGLHDQKGLKNAAQDGSQLAHTCLLLALGRAGKSVATLHTAVKTVILQRTY